MQVYLFTFWRVYLQDDGGKLRVLYFAAERRTRKKQTTLHFYLCFLLEVKFFFSLIFTNNN